VSATHAEGDLDYASSRVHARHGTRLHEREWLRLESSRSLAHFLDTLKAGSFARWGTTLDPQADCHALERALRAEWRRYVGEVTRWHPGGWQRWLGWLTWLPAIGLLARLAQPEPVPQWMLADPLLGPLAPGSPAERSVALEKTSLAPLAAAVRERRPLVTEWRTHWRELAPVRDTATLDSIASLGRIAASTADAESRRRPLARLYRAGAGTALASASHLLFVALDLERLRGGLAVRAVFPPSPAEAV